MLDFLYIKYEQIERKNLSIVYPAFVVTKSSDLMTRGRDFYAVWNQDKEMWSTDEDDVTRMVDKELDEWVKNHRDILLKNVSVKYMWDSSSGSKAAWHNYVQRLQRDNYVQLDSKLIFKSQKTTKLDYCTKRLNYDIAPGPLDCYEELMSTLYDPSERTKLEWAIGSIIQGDSKKLQKFIVLYGSAGTGKGTFLEFVVEKLFPGYCSSFEAKALTSRNNQFALEAFKSNPLVAIQQDGDLSNIADNTKLNSIVSHEKMVVNEKFKSQYESRFHSFLFMGTNEPVYITGSKSGLNRRLIDVRPSGRTLQPDEYDRVISGIDAERGAIADHCLKLYLKLGKNYYNRYEPQDMKEETDDFFNFISDYYIEEIKENGGAQLSKAWTDYKKYCEDRLVKFPYPYKKFRSELKEYFDNYSDRAILDNGERVRKWYSGFRVYKISGEWAPIVKPTGIVTAGIIFKLASEIGSVFDRECSECPAQYATEYDTPGSAWDKVKTKLKDIVTSRIHYVRLPSNHIVIDFDLKDEDGNKSFERNLAEASKWPETYAELSKSGEGIHLHYYYNGDPTLLMRLYSEDIEIKVFTGKSSLRRRLTKCNNKPIATIDQKLLPLKGGKDSLVKEDYIKSENHLRALITKALKKEIHPNTKPAMDFIYKVTEDAYKSGIPYDISNMKQQVYLFGFNSSHQQDYCLDLWKTIHWKSDIPVPGEQVNGENRIIFFDVEVLPNYFCLCWKYRGPEHKVVKMIQPSPEEVFRWMKLPGLKGGYNNRKYDNHIIYARSLGYTNKDLYNLSQDIIVYKKGFFGVAYNFSDFDVYDYISKKQSLKAWEFELHINHQELAYPWDKDLPEDKWQVAADYCANDVLATEAVFEERLPDWHTRQALAELSGLTTNDTNRQHITRILIGDKKQADHVYTDLSKLYPGYELVRGEDGKLHNMYRGTDVGFGGYVFAETGMYRNVSVLDVGNMHGASIDAENKFGPDTENYREIRAARMAIKRGLKTGDFSEAKKMLGGKLAKYLNSPEEADMMQNALKLILNSTYGIAAAKFDNPLRDPRDVNNIIALRGALFMRTLQDEVVGKGFKVVHIKTDSIKVPNASPELIQFIIEFGRKYGYEFEHECTYDRMCLVNDAVYIAKYDSQGIRNKGGKHANEWTATGKQFQVPYIFKTLFSKEPLEFWDFCEMKSVSTSMYLDMNENLGEDEHNYIFVGRVGQFCPVLDGCGGGELKRKSGEDKYDYVTGAKGYRWLESATVQKLHKEDCINKGYYRKLADKAIEAINKYGDFEKFVSDDEEEGYAFDEVGNADPLLNAMNPPEELPWN